MDDIILPRAVLYTSGTAWWSRLQVQFLLVIVYSQYVTYSMHLLYICESLLRSGNKQMLLYFESFPWYFKKPSCWYTITQVQFRNTLIHKTFSHSWLYIPDKVQKNNTNSGENNSNNTLSSLVTFSFALASLQLFNLHKQNAQNQPC